MDKEKAIESFAANAGSLSRLPFVSDSEMRRLYGAEVTAALEGLNRQSQEVNICAGCRDTCCAGHGCEFYAPEFNQCLIFDLRPVVCRFHFCERFKIADRRVITELSEIFLYGVHRLAASGSPNAGYFGPPPFAKLVPGLIATVLPFVAEVREGKVSPEKGRDIIRIEVEKYRHKPL